MKKYKVESCFSCPNSKRRLNLDLKTCIEFKEEQYCDKGGVTHLLEGDYLKFDEKTKPDYWVIPGWCRLEDYE